ncbi:hypothetical protein ACRB68_18050 [Actinomadura sp. RB68]|uniref:Uncharacterized protein n=1 Tax=Actinomadura macrotermitis TaxID=2585200 RepID=A0A7K0BRE6_9ACTN|nr:hypothetical protein [Actinomadura macrotermitis]
MPHLAPYADGSFTVFQPERRVVSQPEIIPVRDKGFRFCQMLPKDL